MKSFLRHSAVFLLVVWGLSCVATGVTRYWDYIVVGAGPGGLQLGHFLQRAGRDYVVLERSNTSGNFFTMYPRHDRLISINKRYTGKTNKEFNFRHDWNSLISDDESLLIRHYSKDFFPHRSVMVQYLNDYKEKLGINVQYNADVRNIRRRYNESITEHQFIMEDQEGNIYICKTLIVATGLWKPNAPQFEGEEYVQGYETVSINPDDFEGKSVLILGRGNTAFEVADNIYGATNLVHMLGRSRVRLSWETHYVGDLRAVNNALLDTYQLKSLDGVLEAPMEEVRLVKRDGKLKLELEEGSVSEADLFDNFALRDPYDVVIRCLGFTFDHDIFHNTTLVERGRGRKKKYPLIGYDYQSMNVPGIYFAGTATHSLDMRKSAGGFLHGFRYTARSLFNLLNWKNHQVPWPSHSGPISNLLNTIIKRINEVSGNYQMFGVLGDVISLRKDGDYEMFEEFPINLLHDFKQHAGHDVDRIIVIVLEYGANFSGPGNDIFRVDRATGEPSEAHQSNFLHPVFYYYRSLPSATDMLKKLPHEALPRPHHMHHIVEDFLTAWDAPTSHVLPLRRFLENVVDDDLRSFFAEDCMKMALAFQKVPRTCSEHFLSGSGMLGTERLLTEAVKSGLLV